MSNIIDFNEKGEMTASGSITVTDGTGTSAITTDMPTNVSNCVGGGWLGGTYIPYTTYSYPTTPHYDVQIRKVENGWLLVKGGKEYILTKPEQMVAYLTDEKKK